MPLNLVESPSLKAGDSTKWSAMLCLELWRLRMSLGQMHCRSTTRTTIVSGTTSQTTQAQSRAGMGSDMVLQSIGMMSGDDKTFCFEVQARGSVPIK